MDDNCVFKFIWRLNAVLIAFCVLFAAGVIAWETVISDMLTSPRSVEIINFDQNDGTLEETIKLLPSEGIQGTQTYLITAVKKQTFIVSDPSRKSTPHNSKQAEPKTLGLMVTYIDKDSSKENRLSKTDAKSLLAASPDASQNNILLTKLKTTPVISTLKTGETTNFQTTHEGTIATL